MLLVASSVCKNALLSLRVSRSAWEDVSVSCPLNGAQEVFREDIPCALFLIVVRMMRGQIKGTDNTIILIQGNTALYKWNLLNCWEIIEL